MRSQYSSSPPRLLPVAARYSSMKEGRGILTGEDGRDLGQILDGWVPGTHDVLERQQVGVAAVAPRGSARIDALALGDDGSDVLARAALVAGAPEDDARMIAIAVDELAYAVQVGLAPGGILRDELGGVGFVPGLVHDVDSELVGQVEVLDVGRIVGGPNEVDVELLHEDEIAAQRLHVHPAATSRVEHVAVDSVELDRNSVDEDGLIADLDFPKADSRGEDLDHGALRYRRAPA